MLKGGGKAIYGNGTPPAPDVKVRKAEDDFIKQSSSIQAVSSLSLTNEHFPTRPAHGSIGDPVTLWANFFGVKLDNDLSYFRYSVQVEPQGKAPKASKPKVRRLLALLLELSEFTTALTDSGSNLYSRTKLPGIPREETIVFRAPGDAIPVINPAKYTIRIQESGTVLVSQYHESLGSINLAGPRFVQRDEVLQTLNTIIGHYAQIRPDLVTLGQNRHYAINPSDCIALSKGLQSLRGFYISFRPATSRILLNVNVSHTVCFEPIRLDMLLKAFGRSDLKPLAKRLKLLRLQRLHLRGQGNNTGNANSAPVVFWDFARPDDGANEVNPPQVTEYGAGPKKVKFFLANEPNVTGSRSGTTAGKATSGSYISIWDYFSKKYPTIKMFENYPVINVGSGLSPRYLPVEACQILPGKVSAAKLNDEQTRHMMNFACRKPADNADSIMDAGRRVLSLDPPRNTSLKKNGLSVLPELITVQARVLKPPPVKYAPNKTIHTVSGSWNLSHGVQFHKGASIGKWTYMWIRKQPGTSKNFDDFENPTTLLKTVEKFITVSKGCGVSLTKENLLIKRPIVNLMPGQEANNTEAILKALRDLYKDENNRDMPRFILIVLPFSDAGLYGTIKTYCDITAGIHTVCVIGSKFAKEQPSYFANVVMKFNLKAGGINQALDGLKLGIINEGKTMVVGIDVTHPSPLSEDTAPSVAGVVASVDNLLGQWACALRHQKGRTEMVADLEAMFISRLDLWRTKNKVLPQNILIYRDGVSEGQYQIVYDEELPLVRKACTKLYAPKEQPAITLIIVGKRHHVRFYPTKAEEADKTSWNCKSGTVVDRGITDVRGWNFYLQAHACLKGTARSAHYYVLVDEIFRSKAKRSMEPAQKNAADALEQLTHNLCYMFGRATKAVSICPPAYYADLLCERSRLYLGRLFDPATAVGTSKAAAKPDAGAADYAIHPRLRNSMFYI